MASNLFGPGNRPYTGRSAAEIKADQARAMAEDKRKDREAAHASGRDRRSVGNGGGR